MLHVVHHEVEVLHAGGLGVAHADADDHRARRPGRGELHDPQAVARLDVVQKPVLRELRRELDGAHVHRLGLVLTGAESEASYGYGGGYGYGYSPDAGASTAATPTEKAKLDA